MVIRIGLDTSKSVFQLHGVDAAEKAALTQAKMVAFFEGLPPGCLVALEACRASHHWARVLQAMGHEAQLIGPQLAKPYVMRDKTDAADASALREAVSRPRMRFVPVKTPDQQAALMLAGVRDGLIRRRTQLANIIRGHTAEFGLMAAQGSTGSGTCWRTRNRSRAYRIWPAGCSWGWGMSSRGSWPEPPLPRQSFGLGTGPTRRAGAWRRCQASGRWGIAPGNEDPRPAGLPLGPRLRCLARPDAEEPFHRRQAAARRHHPSGRRGPARRAGRRRHGGDPSSQARPGQALGLARRAAGAQADRARSCSAGQHDRPCGVAHDGHRRGLRPGPHRHRIPGPHGAVPVAA